MKTNTQIAISLFSRTDSFKNGSVENIHKWDLIAAEIFQNENYDESLRTLERFKETASGNPELIQFFYSLKLALYTDLMEEYGEIITRLCNFNKAQLNAQHELMTNMKELTTNQQYILPVITKMVETYSDISVKANDSHFTGNVTFEMGSIKQEIDSGLLINGSVLSISHDLLAKNIKEMVERKQAFLKEAFEPF